MPGAIHAHHVPHIAPHPAPAYATTSTSSCSPRTNARSCSRKPLRGKKGKEGKGRRENKRRKSKFERELGENKTKMRRVKNVAPPPHRASEATRGYAAAGLCLPEERKRKKETNTGRAAEAQPARRPGRTWSKQQSKREHARLAGTRRARAGHVSCADVRRKQLFGGSDDMLLPWNSFGEKGAGSRMWREGKRRGYAGSEGRESAGRGQKRWGGGAKEAKEMETYFIETDPVRCTPTLRLMIVINAEDDGAHPKSHQSAAVEPDHSLQHFELVVLHIIGLGLGISRSKAVLLVNVCSRFTLRFRSLPISNRAPLVAQPHEN
ncbi:hypothetical protein C8R45DRAFT_944392 [Mycena sanguinolenta]|nr:hypothetical protein C8R45DRAFT_944392 [Mycena sanguinolenta]